MSARIVVLMAALVLVGCGGGGDEGANEPAPTTTEAAPTTTEEAAGEVPETPLTATLTQGYKVVGGQNADVAESELPVAPGTVEARWYRSGGNYVAVYVGVPADAAEGLCPGNSIQVGSTFENVSNSPVAGTGACQGAPKIAAQGVETCEDLLVYVSDIPADKAGTLYASVERYQGDTITGVTGSISTETGDAPEVSLTDLGC